MSAASSSLVDQKISEADALLAQLSGNMSEARLQLLKSAMDQANDVDFDDQVEKAAANFDDDSTDDEEDSKRIAVRTRTIPGRRQLEKPVTDDTDSDEEYGGKTLTEVFSLFAQLTATHAKRCNYNLTPKEARAIHEKVVAACQDPKDLETFGAVYDFYTDPECTRDCWNALMDEIGGDIVVETKVKDQTKVEVEDDKDEEFETDRNPDHVADRKAFVHGAKYAMDIMAPFTSDYRPGVNRHCIPHEGKTTKEEKQSMYAGFFHTITRREKIAKAATEKGKLDVVVPVVEYMDGWKDPAIPKQEAVIYYHIPDEKLDAAHDIAVAAKYAGITPVVEGQFADAVESIAVAPAVVSAAADAVVVTVKPVRRIMPIAVVAAAAVAVADVKSDVVVSQPSKKRKAEVENGSMQSQIDARVKAAHLAGIKPQPMTLEEARQLRVEKKAKTIDLRKAKKAEVKATAQKAVAQKAAPKQPKVITPAMQSSIDAIVASVKARAALSSSSSYKAAFEVAIVDSLPSAASADEYFDIASDIIASSTLDDVVADDDL